MRRSSPTSARACSCPACGIDDGITIAADLADAARARAILLVVPAQAVRSATKSLASSLAMRTPVIVCAKGIERGTKKFMTEIVAECAPERDAGDPVRTELCRRRGARHADRGDACRARR